MDVVIRSAVMFVFVWALMRLIGKRELGQMEPFDLIVLVVIGDLLQQGVNQQDLSVTGAFLAIGTIALLTLLWSWLSFRFKPVRAALQGRPVVLVEDGRAIEENLRRERVTVEELQAQARLRQIASLSDVRWAIIETNGQVSFLPKQRA